MSHRTVTHTSQTHTLLNRRRGKSKIEGLKEDLWKRSALRKNILIWCFLNVYPHKYKPTILGVIEGINPSREIFSSAWSSTLAEFFAFCFLSSSAKDNMILEWISCVFVIQVWNKRASSENSQNATIPWKLISQRIKIPVSKIDYKEMVNHDEESRKNCVNNPSTFSRIYNYFTK